MLEEVYLIEGMSCAACSSAVERVTRKLEGVERSDVNLTTNKMIIYYDEGKVDRELIMAKVKIVLVTKSKMKTGKRAMNGFLIKPLQS